MEQQQEAAALQEAASKTEGVCRVDLSAVALLLSSQLAPPQPGSALQLPQQAACLALVGRAAWSVPGAPAAAPAAGAAAIAGGETPVEDATQAAAPTTDGAEPDEAAEPAEGQAEAALAATGGSRRQQRRVYVHGNYHRYYGYRFYGDQRPEDPRLAVFERRWFARRRCLDVGCNEGLITLALVARYHPRSMLGVDIDSALVAKACRHLRDARTSAAQQVRLSRRGGVPAEERKDAKGTAASLSQTLFTHADFLESDVEAASLDTVTCFSVTKWIHLNRGDEGLKALFAAFWRALAPGGLLLVEPQPWSSYRAAASKIRREAAPPGTFFHRQDELQLRPAQFPEYLCEVLGFRLVKHFGVEESTTGFNRPMLLLRKPVAAQPI